MPRGKVLPSLGADIEVAFGKPVFVEDLWRARHRGDLTDEECYSAVAKRIQLALAEIKVRDCM
eukprot:scaffold80133_cov46-Prasinocladus_malaysianus.AAC.2